MNPTYVPLPIPTPNDIKYLDRCDPSVRLRRLLELAVVRMLLDKLLTLGPVVLNEGEGDEDLSVTDLEQGMELIFNLDDCYLFVKEHWVRIVLGNDGWDCISDYTVNLEENIKEVNTFAESLQYWR